MSMTPLWKRFEASFPKLCASRGWNFWRIARTFLLMGIIRSLDCYRDVGLTFRLWWSMLTKWNLPSLFDGGLLSFGLKITDFILLAAGVALITIVSHMGREVPMRRKIAASPISTCAVICLLILLIAIFGAYGIGYDSTQFIYNQF